MRNGHVINNKDDESYEKALIPHGTLTDTFPQGSSLAKWSCEVSSLAMAFSKDLWPTCVAWMKHGTIMETFHSRRTTYLAVFCEILIVPSRTAVVCNRLAMFTVSPWPKWRRYRICRNNSPGSLIFQTTKLRGPLFRPPPPQIFMYSPPLWKITFLGGHYFRGGSHYFGEGY